MNDDTIEDEAGRRVTCVCDQHARREERVVNVDVAKREILDSDLWVSRT